MPQALRDRILFKESVTPYWSNNALPDISALSDINEPLNKTTMLIHETFNNFSHGSRLTKHKKTWAIHIACAPSVSHESHVSHVSHASDITWIIDAIWAT